MNNRKIGIFLLLSVVGISGAVASEIQSDPTLNARIDAYLKRDIQNIDSRYSPLRVIQTFEIDSELRNVEQALKHVLGGSGFTLCDSNAHKPVNAGIMASAIPDVHRTINDVSLLEALRILVGSHHDILIDPVTREVGFALNSHGQSLGLPQ